METLHDKKQHHPIKKNIKVEKKTNYTTDILPTLIKVYFPNISINAKIETSKQTFFFMGI